MHKERADIHTGNRMRESCTLQTIWVTGSWATSQGNVFPLKLQARGALSTNGFRVSGAPFSLVLRICLLSTARRWAPCQPRPACAMRSELRQLLWTREREVLSLVSLCNEDEQWEFQQAVYVRMLNYYSIKLLWIIWNKLFTKITFIFKIIAGSLQNPYRTFFLKNWEQFAFMTQKLYIFANELPINCQLH